MLLREDSCENVLPMWITVEACVLGAKFFTSHHLNTRYPSEVVDDLDIERSPSFQRKHTRHCWLMQMLY